ncbi:hypothetical protein BDGGKGIB_02905 [Nodularia sphaerocarpa UHCC 0038]|nr:hypothetical protein BDGGKGIB_02905 [Nodularia sphaerocarpa UHCC 0038]
MLTKEKDRLCVIGAFVNVGHELMADNYSSRLGRAKRNPTSARILGLLRSIPPLFSQLARMLGFLASTQPTIKINVRGTIEGLAKNTFPKLTPKRDTGTFDFPLGRVTVYKSRRERRYHPNNTLKNLHSNTYTIINLHS